MFQCVERWEGSKTYLRERERTNGRGMREGRRETEEEEGGKLENTN